MAMASFPLGFDVDETVDDTLVGTITFFDDYCMSSIAQVEFAAEKSPFYESDSGVSDVTGFSSASPHRSGDMLDELVDNRRFRPFGFEDEPEDDGKLMGYFNQDLDIGGDVDIEEMLAESHCLKENEQIPSVTATTVRSGQNLLHRSVGNVAGPVTRRQTAGMRQPASSATSFLDRELNKAVASGDSDVDIDDADDCFNRKPSSGTAKGSVRIIRPGTPILKSNIHCVASKASQKGGTSVKVLRVVHQTPSVGHNIQDDVVKALEDRNRKNAEQAKLNRQKKKAYIHSLEQKMEESQSHVDLLQKRLEEEKAEKDSLKQEVEYLKAVLANQSALASLLKNIPAVKGVNLSSSFVSRKRSAEMDHSYTPNKKPCSQSQSLAGVCLHVDKDIVSLEFCRHCAQKAKGVPEST